MKHYILPALVLASCAEAQSPASSESPAKRIPAVENFPTEISADLSGRFTQLALDCVQQEFPNKISRTTNDAKSIDRPQALFPVFYGCFDWHSAVHGHW